MNVLEEKGITGAEAHSIPILGLELWMCEGPLIAVYNEHFPPTDTRPLTQSTY
jgi:hypothetical protein